jgi:glutathione S-transferase
MSVPSVPLRLYEFRLSGHSHRARLGLSLLGLPFERIEIDLTKGAHKTPAFLEKNPLGQVPVLEDGDFVLADSTAILVYLAARYDETDRWLPRDPQQRGRVQRWLSIAAGEVANGPSAARRARVFGRSTDEKAEAAATRLFAMMETHLEGRSFLVDPNATLADVAMYTYTAVAPEGGVSLEPYPNIRAWLARIEGLPGFVAMPRAGS